MQRNKGRFYSTIKSHDAVANTIEMEVSTENPVRGVILSHAPGAIDLSRFDGVAPFLNEHKLHDAREVLGKVLKSRIEDRKLIATVLLSRAPEDAGIVSKILDGILTQTSVGWQALQWGPASVDPKTGAHVRTAIRWFPYEVSLTPVAADSTRVRSENANSGANIRKENPVKTKKTGAVDPALEDDNDNDAVTPPVNERAQRNTAIRSLCDQNGMTRSFCDALVDSEGDLIAARAAVNTELQRRTPMIRATVGVDHTDPREIMQRQVQGFIAAATGAAPADNAREFVGLSTMQHFREMLERNNVNTRRMSDGDVLQRSFGTGDAPMFLQEVMQATVLAPYARAVDPIMQLVRTQTVPDFRSYNFLRGELEGGLVEQSEHGEFERTPLVESKISTALKSYARGIDITERALRNDDKGLITGVPAQFAAMAAAKDAELVTGVITANPVVDDGDNLFSVAHGNLTTEATPLSVEALSDGRLAMRSLVGLDGEAILNISPRFLVVSKELETAAEQLLAQITPATIQDVQPIKLSLIVSPRLPAFQWLLAADPASAPVLAVLRLAGQEGPRVERTSHWNTFSVGFRVSHHVNAAAIGFRGLALWTQGEDSNSVILE